MIYQSTNAIRKHLTPAQEATWPKEDYRVAVYLMLLEQQCTEEATRRREILAHKGRWSITYQIYSKSNQPFVASNPAVSRPVQKDMLDLSAL